MTHANSKIEVGDKIELRHLPAWDETPQYTWESVEVLHLKGHAPSGHLMFEALYNDGRVTHESTARIWRWRLKHR